MTPHHKPINIIPKPVHFKASNLLWQVTGGDGTVGWVLGCLGELHKQGRSPIPPTAIIPLGIRNDLSRSFGWVVFPLIWRSAIKRTLGKATYSPTSRLGSWKLSISMPSRVDLDTPHSLKQTNEAIIKPQYVNHIPKAVQGNVGQVLKQKNKRDAKAELCADLELNQVIDRNVADLSGGELQSYVIVVEHDLSVLDYLSYFICCLYGKPGAYGVVTLPFSVREEINIFLDGFVPTENLRFCDITLTFRVSATTQESAKEIETCAQYRYPTMSKTKGGFKLKAVEGEFTNSQIIAGLLKPDTMEGSKVEIPEFHVSYKPQKISPKFPHSVRHLLHSKIRDSYMHPQFVSDVMKPLQIEHLMD
ncbi:ABC transporter E family member 2 [Tanacetum coccineum]